MPTISVIVPVYNTELYLKRCIDSILAQTFSDFELILVDDGSTDNSGKICDDYAEKNNRIVVIHKENGGVSSARNTGLNSAKGEFITFCDGDDHWGENWLKSLYTQMIKDSADLVNGNFTRCSENGDELKRTNHLNGSFDFNNSKERIEFIIRKVLIYGLGWEVCTKIFCTRLITQNMIRFCETCENYAEDMSFVLEYLLYCSKITTSECAEYYYVMHPGSMMANSTNSIKLNSMNEVSKSFGNRFYKISDLNNKDRYFGVIHFLIMNNEYKKNKNPEDYSPLDEEINKIVSKQWFIEKTRLTLKSKFLLTSAIGEQRACNAELLSCYFLYRDRRFFSLIQIYFRLYCLIVFPIMNWVYWTWKGITGKVKRMVS